MYEFLLRNFLVMMKSWKHRLRNQTFSRRHQEGWFPRRVLSLHHDSVCGLEWKDLGLFSWEILTALFCSDRLLAVLKAGSSDFTAFQLFTKVNRNRTGLSASSWMHFRVCGILSNFLLCNFYLRIPTQFHSFFPSHSARRNLIKPCSFFSHWRRKTVCGLLKAKLYPWDGLVIPRLASRSAWDGRFVGVACPFPVPPVKREEN